MEDLTQNDVILLVESAFARVKRPEHFTDYNHCEECKEHDKLLRSRDRATIRVSDGDNPGWNPLDFITPEGFLYYFPSLAKLALSKEGEAFLINFVPFHLCDALTNKKGHHSHRWLAVLNKQQCTAILKYVRYVAKTKRDIMTPYGAYPEELDRAVAFWSTECKSHESE